MVNGERAYDARLYPYEFHQKAHDKISQKIDREKQIGPFGPEIKQEKKQGGHKLENAFHELDGKDKIPATAAVHVAADLAEARRHGQRNDETAAEGSGSLARESFVEIDGGESAEKASHVAFPVDQHVAGKAVSQDDRCLHADQHPQDAADVNVELAVTLHSRHLNHPGSQSARGNANDLKKEIARHL